MINFYLFYYLKCVLNFYNKIIVLKVCINENIILLQDLYNMYVILTCVVFTDLKLIYYAIFSPFIVFLTVRNTPFLPFFTASGYYILLFNLYFVCRVALYRAVFGVFSEECINFLISLWRSCNIHIIIKFD
jgi:hypothetical protein